MYDSLIDFIVAFYLNPQVVNITPIRNVSEIEINVFILCFQFLLLIYWSYNNDMNVAGEKH